MIRRGLVSIAALLAAAPAFGAEGGVIRGGEHVGFSRIVLTVEPTTEWSLETRDGGATISFPGKALDFSTIGTFEKLPKTRIKAVRTTSGPSGTAVEVEIDCDCRVSTAFVGAQYLALDVADRDAAPPAPVAPKPAPEDPAARAEREAAAVASAEEVLLRQIARAASQGLIELSESSQAPETQAEAGTETPGSETPPAAVAEAPPLARPVPASAPLTTVSATAPRAALAEIPLGLFDHEQVKATTVFDRDTRLASARMKEQPPAPECLPDAVFDFAQWSNGQALFAQEPALERRVLGEFDAPDAEALAELARLYIRFGFGIEAENLLRGIETPFPDRAVLLDLARAVEGRPVAADGPLALTAICPGSHGLWLAIGGAAPAYHDAASFTSVQQAFEALPIDTRALIGPRLMSRLLDAGQPEAARLIHDTAVRPGEASSDETRLGEARLMAAEGHPMEAARAMNLLATGNSGVSVEALIRLARLTLDADLPAPGNLVTDLRAAALENRHTEREPELRALLAEELAREAALGLAITEIRSARADLPDNIAAIDALAVRLLAAADPAEVGEAAYAEIMLTQGPLIGPDPANDAARLSIAAHLLAIGLPRAALDLLAPATARGAQPTRMRAAEAHLRLGDPDAALADVANIDGPAAAELRSRAYALKGDFAGAARVLAEAGLTTEAAGYAWPSGDWPSVATEDPNRAAMASYMAGRAGGKPAPTPAAEPDSLSPALAFQEPLPQLDRPSLGAARRLLASGQQVEGFIQSVLTPTPNPR
ncbi:hypothetical protein [uncultured Amaricoccus sp.]|uniref:hypothetical protein n=1 Tax=uncultured Amaricoccus sp. TaxID=339341 RepID=UPI002629DF92|nr:hypothetical protein [uncultured Amaricoccus sp.]